MCRPRLCRSRTRSSPLMSGESDVSIIAMSRPTQNIPVCDWQPTICTSQHRRHCRSPPEPRFHVEGTIGFRNHCLHDMIHVILEEGEEPCITHHCNNARIAQRILHCQSPLLVD